MTSFRSVQLQHAARKAVAVPVSDGCCARSVGWDAVGKKSICQEGAPCPNLILLGSSQLAQRVPWVCRVGRRFFGWGKGYQVKGGGFGWKGCIYIYMMGKDLGLDDFLGLTWSCTRSLGRFTRSLGRLSQRFHKQKHFRNNYLDDCCWMAFRTRLE